LAAEILINQQVIPANPTKARKLSDFLMRKVACLLLPIHDLACRNGQCQKSFLLDKIRDFKGQLVQKRVCSLIVVEVQLGGGIFNFFEDAGGQPDT